MQACSWSHSALVMCGLCPLCMIACAACHRGAGSSFLSRREPAGFSPSLSRSTCQVGSCLSPSDRRAPPFPLAPCPIIDSSYITRPQSRSLALCVARGRELVSLRSLTPLHPLSPRRLPAFVQRPRAPPNLSRHHTHSLRISPFPGAVTSVAVRPLRPFWHVG